MPFLCNIFEKIATTIVYVWTKLREDAGLKDQYGICEPIGIYRS